MNKKFKIISRELFRKLRYNNIQNSPFIIAFFGVPGSGKTYISKRLEKRYKAIRINSHDILKIIDKEKIAENPGNPKSAAKLKEEYIYHLISNALFKNKRIILDKSIDREYKKLLKICKSKKFPYFFIRLKIGKRKAIKRINKRGIHGNWLTGAMNKWQKDWKTAAKRIESHIFLYEPSPDLKKLYSKLDSALSPN